MPRLLSDFISTDSLMRQSHSVSLWRQLSNYLSVTPIGERFPDPSVAYLSVPLREVIWKWGLKFAQRNSSGAPLRSGTVFVSDFNDGCEGPQPSSSEYDAGVEAIWVSIGSSPISSRKRVLLLPRLSPSRRRHRKPCCVSVFVRKEFPINAKIHSYFRRIWAHMQGLRLANYLSIGFRHSVLL